MKWRNCGCVQEFWSTTDGREHGRELSAKLIRLGARGDQIILLVDLSIPHLNIVSLAVAGVAKRDQVFFGIVTLVAPKLFVMNLQVRHRIA
jgi:hypothetical protein